MARIIKDKAIKYVLLAKNKGDFVDWWLAKSEIDRVFFTDEEWRKKKEEIYKAIENDERYLEKFDKVVKKIEREGKKFDYKYFIENENWSFDDFKKVYKNAIDDLKDGFYSRGRMNKTFVLENKTYYLINYFPDYRDVPDYDSLYNSFTKIMIAKNFILKNDPLKDLKFEIVRWI